jgi:hypothetical protein
MLMPRRGLSDADASKRTSDADASIEGFQMLMPRRGLSDADASKRTYRC